MKLKRITIKQVPSTQILIVDWASIPEKGLALLLSLLSKSESVRANNITHVKRKNEYIAGRGLTRITLSWFYQNHICQNHRSSPKKGYIAPNQWDIQENKFGKPEIINKTIKYINFNISHSTEYLAIAMSTDGKIGIDIEPIEKELVNPFPSQLFSTHEQITLRSLTKKQQTTFFKKLWTAKEAIAKCIGQGTDLDFSKIEIEKPNKDSKNKIKTNNIAKINHYIISKNKKNSMISIAIQK